MLVPVTTVREEQEIEQIVTRVRDLLHTYAPLFCHAFTYGGGEEARPFFKAIRGPFGMQDLRVLAAALFEGVQYNKTFCALQLMARNRDCQISPEHGGLVLTLPSSPPTPAGLARGGRGGGGSRRQGRRQP
eukprot:2800675-Rhodomonas_salina.1